MRRGDLIRPALPWTLAAAALAAATLPGCGSGGKSYANGPRPAAPIVITAAITQGGVNVSPTQFGAGLIQLVVVNLTNRSQQLSLVSNGGASFRQQTGPINPEETARLQAQLGSGYYSLGSSDSALDGARLTVGPQRPNSSSNRLPKP